jgi:hypothetical protein
MNNTHDSTIPSSQLDAYLQSLGISYDELLFYVNHRKIGNHVGILFYRGAISLN